MKTKTKKLLTKAVVATTLFTAVGFAPLGSVLVAQAEEVSADAIADTFSRRSITIWKYQVTDASELGERGDGTKVDTDKKVLPGIKFTIQRVKPVNPDTVLTNPRVQKLTDDYIIDTDFTAQTVTTDENGKAYLDLLTGRGNDGIYLVTELADDRDDLSASDGKKVGTPADPFFVYVPQTNRTDLGTLIYDVEVQPKNILESLVNPDKTINGEKGDSVYAGQEFQWELEAKIPAGLWQKAGQTGPVDVYKADGTIDYSKDFTAGEVILIEDGTGVLQPNFSMTDKLNPTLTYKDGTAKMQVRKEGETDWTDLASDEYTVTFDATEKILVTKLTKEGLEKVGTAANEFTEIRTVFTTTVGEGWNGILDNTFTINYQIPGQAPKEVTPPPATNPKYYTGGFDIEKTAEDKTNKLADAEFMIALTKEEAEAGIFLATDGKAYAEADLPDGLSYILATSDAQGRAEFNGLELDWVDDNTADGFVQDVEVSRKYWVVETKAPDGYELLKKPVEILVTLTTADDDAIEVEIVNKKKTDLPFTGGEGTTILVAIALGAITVGTVAIMVDKKRRKA